MQQYAHGYMYVLHEYLLESNLPFKFNSVVYSLTHCYRNCQQVQEDTTWRGSLLEQATHYQVPRH